MVNYRNTDTVRQKTALRQFSKTNKTPKPDNRNQYKTIKEISCRKMMSSQLSKTNKTPKPDNRNQYQNNKGNKLSENYLESSKKTNFFQIFRYKYCSLLLYFNSGLRTGNGRVTEINNRSTDIVNYRNTDTVRQKTAIRQFSKTNKTTTPDNRNQYETI